MIFVIPVRPVFSLQGLKFQSESFLFQFLILPLVETEEEGLFLLRRVGSFVCLFKHSEPLHLAVEVAAVETHIQYGLVEVLQFLDGEHLGQQFKSNGFKVNLLTQCLPGLAQYPVVIKSQLRNFIQCKPTGFGSIISPPSTFCILAKA